MRRIVASLWMSLDGVMESPEQWAFTYSNDEMEAVNNAGMAASDAMLLGRTTYQEFAAYWPRQSGPIADYLNASPKYVVSTTLDTVEWPNSILIGGNAGEELTRLKEQPGKDITVIGSATLVRSLLRDGLLDELHLSIPPLVMGRGRRLFADERDQMPLKLVDSRTFGTGVLYLIYQPLSRKSEVGSRESEDAR